MKIHEDLPRCLTSSPFSWGIFGKTQPTWKDLSSVRFCRRCEVTKGKRRDRMFCTTRLCPVGLMPGERGIPWPCVPQNHRKPEIHLVASCRLFRFLVLFFQPVHSLLARANEQIRFRRIFLVQSSNGSLTARKFKVRSKEIFAAAVL